MSVDADFNWEGGDVVLPRQDAVAVYENAEGDIVIRQQCDGLVGDRDDTVVVSLISLPRLIAALQKLASKSGG